MKTGNERIVFVIFPPSLILDTVLIHTEAGKEWGFPLQGSQCYQITAVVLRHSIPHHLKPREMPAMLKLRL